MIEDLEQIRKRHSTIIGPLLIAEEKAQEELQSSPLYLAAEAAHRAVHEQMSLRRQELKAAEKAAKAAK
jgi:hypothetical protein